MVQQSVYGSDSFIKQNLEQNKNSNSLNQFERTSTPIPIRKRKLYSPSTENEIPSYLSWSEHLETFQTRLKLRGAKNSLSGIISGQIVTFKAQKTDIPEKKIEHISKKKKLIIPNEEDGRIEGFNDTLSVSKKIMPLLRGMMAKNMLRRATSIFKKDNGNNNFSQCTNKNLEPLSSNYVNFKNNSLYLT